MRRDTRHTWVLRGAGALVLAATFGYLPYRLYTRSGFAHYLDLRQSLITLRVANARMRAENDRLARQVEALRADPREIERVARAELGLVLPGEVIFDLGGAP